MAQQANEDTDPLASSQKDFYIVLAIAGGGAVLGLSTLSFVEEPGDHLKNLYIGAAIGTIVGVAFVAYSQASKSKEIFNGDLQANNSGGIRFDTVTRKNWHQKSFFANQMNDPKQVPIAGYSFKF